MKFASAQPYTEAERERDEAIKREGRMVRLTRLRALKSGQRYNQHGTPQSRAKDLRIVGEKPDA